VPEAVGPDLRHCHRAHVHARPAVDGRVQDDGRHHEGGGQREQREQLGAHRLHAERHRAQQRADQRGHHARRPAASTGTAMSKRVASVAVVYMPMPKNAPCPNEKYPE
jgi:hypothetical protein